MPTDIGHMREDAIKRSREMYARAVQRNIDVNPSPPIETLEETAKESLDNQGIVNHNILNEFLQDKDKMLIIALLVILSQEECDNTILFALMFLLI